MYGLDVLILPKETICISNKDLINVVQHLRVHRHLISIIVVISVSFRGVVQAVIRIGTVYVHNLLIQKANFLVG